MKKVLIFQTAFLGDVVLATPLIAAVKVKYPDSSVKFLTIPYSAPILENHPLLEEVIIFDKRGNHRYKNTVNMTKRLKSEKFDLAIIPHRSIRSAAMVYFAGIPERIGFDRSAGSFLFNQVIEYGQDLHEVKRNLSLLGLENSAGYSPAVFPGEKERIEVEKLLTEFDITGDFVCIAPGSIWNTKRWLAEHFAKLIKLIMVEVKVKIVLTGAPGELQLCEEVAKSAAAEVSIAAGRLNPLESAQLYKMSKAVISNDSAAGHIAAAVGTKVVSIFGPSVPAFGFAPFGEEHQIAEHPDLYCRPCRIHGSKTCPEKHFRCMKELLPETVLEKLRAILKI